MNIICDRSDLYRALTMLRRGIPKTLAKKQIIPWLADVLVTASAPGQLSLQTTDLDTAMCVTLPATVDSDAVTSVELRALADAIQRDAGTVTLALEEKHGDTRFGQMQIGSTILPTHPQFVEDRVAWMPLPAGDNGQTLSLTAAEIHAVADRVAYCALHENNRPALQVIHFVQHNSVTHAVAADGFRLAVLPLPGADAITEQGGINAPATVFEAFADAHGKCSDGADLTWNATHIGIVWDDGELTAEMRSKRIIVTYPNWPQLVRAANAHNLQWTVDPAMLKPVIEDAHKILKRNDTEITRFVFDPAGVTVTAHDADVGTVCVRFETATKRNGAVPGTSAPLPCRLQFAKAANGGKHHIAIEASYIRDLIRSLPTAALTAGIGNPSESVVWTTPDGYKQVMMPISVKWDD